MMDSSSESGWMESVNKTLAIYAGALGAKLIASSALSACAEAGEEGRLAYIDHVSQSIGDPARRSEFLSAVDHI